MNIGIAIKELRKQKQLSQRQLATAAKITQASLSKIENGKRPSIQTLNRICSTLGIPDFLLYILAIEEIDVPEKNRVLYSELLPVIKSLVFKIAL